MLKNKEPEKTIANIEPEKNIDVTNIKEVIENIFGNDDELGNDIDKLETAKIILSIILNNKNIGSTSNLESEHIEDISDAEMLNEIFDNELIDTKINSFRIHRRSLTDKPRNLLEILSEIVGQGALKEQKLGILEAIGNRFKS